MVRLKENSNLIELYSSSSSIWRGDLWSEINLDVKVDECFVNKEEEPVGRYILVAYIEDCAHKGSLIGHDNKQTSFAFERSSEGHRIVASDQYHNLNVKVHQDMFSSGDAFRVLVVVEDLLNEAGRLFFGASSEIAVTDLTFSFEEEYLESPYSMLVEDKTYAWYSKCGGENSGLNTNITLMDTIGPVSNIETDVNLCIGLIYDDESPAPLTPICPLKDRKSHKVSSNPLFRIVGGETKLTPRKPKTDVTFRIEEVSFHHSGHDGFKLMVYTDNVSIIVHPAVSKETIIVLSKPKGVQRRESELSIVLEEPPRKRGRKSMKGVTKPNQEEMVKIPFEALLSVYMRNNRCFFCDRFISKDRFFMPSSHTMPCTFATQIAPLTCQFVTQQEDFKPAPELKRKSRASESSTRPKRSTTNGTNMNEHKKLDTIPNNLEHHSQAYNTSRLAESSQVLPNQSHEVEQFKIQNDIFGSEANIFVDRPIVSNYGQNQNSEQAGWPELTLVDAKSLEENEKYLLQEPRLHHYPRVDNRHQHELPSQTDDRPCISLKKENAFSSSFFAIPEKEPVDSFVNNTNPSATWIENFFQQPQSASFEDSTLSTSSSSSQASKQRREEWHSSYQTPIRLTQPQPSRPAQKMTEDHENDNIRLLKNDMLQDIGTSTIQCKVETPVQQNWDAGYDDDNNSKNREQNGILQGINCTPIPCKVETPVQQHWHPMSTSQQTNRMEPGQTADILCKVETPSLVTDIIPSNQPMLRIEEENSVEDLASFGNSLLTALDVCSTDDIGLNNGYEESNDNNMMAMEGADELLPLV